MPQIDGERLLGDLAALRGIGASGPGVVRPAFGARDMEARHWLADRFEAAGLEASIDGVGNVVGRSRNSGPALLIGSHSDTQPTGGWLDGALGVIYGLEVARALAEDAGSRDLAVDAVSWQDEESRFLGCLGSRSFCGLLTAEIEQGISDGDGVALADAIAEAGLEGVARLGLEEGRYLGFLEAHIEQGPQLEDDGKLIGIVDTIVGLRGIDMTFEGQQNHAGTTMMAGRKDAATALFEFAHRVNEEFPKAMAERTVWTMGRAVLEPGAVSIVPGRAELSLQFRDVSTAVLDGFEEIVDGLVADINAKGKATATARRSRTPIAPTEMDPGLRAHLMRAAETHAAGKWVEMPSGAFHDAGIVSGVLPSAMLFIPSIGGISHDFAEDSHGTDIVLGCQVLADAAASMLASARP
jgi:N-carbamoyl-L-amino-acid hydrolase